MSDARADNAWMDRRTLLLALLGAAAVGPLAWVQGATSTASSSAHNVLDDIPANLHAGIRSGSGARDLGEFVDRSARIARAAGLPLYFPAGIYAMKTWSVPAGLTVLTEGRATVFRQLDTHGKPQRFIEVFSDGVRLWPGGAATIDGGMRPRGVNATSFNSGIRVHAAPGVRIEHFECGDIYGRNLGGDVFETGCTAGGYLGNCIVGTVHGDNVYRNVVSITGGASGRIAGVVQDGGCGLMTLDVEPDPSSAPIGRWSIGPVVGHRIAVVGEPVVPIDAIDIQSLDLDNSRPESNPQYDAGGINRRQSVVIFETGVRLRNVSMLSVGQARIANFERAAIEDIGSQPADTVSGQVRFGQLTITNCGATTGYEVVTQKLKRLVIERIDSTVKAREGVGTFLAGSPVSSIELGGGAIRGQVVLGSKGDFAARYLAVQGAGKVVFREVTGRLGLSDSRIDGAEILFDKCTGPIAVASSTLASRQIARLSSRPAVRNSRINGVTQR